MSMGRRKLLSFLVVTGMDAKSAKGRKGFSKRGTKNLLGFLTTQNSVLSAKSFGSMNLKKTSSDVYPGGAADTSPGQDAVHPYSYDEEPSCKNCKKPMVLVTQPY